MVNILHHISAAQGVLRVTGLVAELHGVVLAGMAKNLAAPVLYIASDAMRARAIRQNLQFFAPNMPIVFLPAWDCLPYDRMSPSRAVSAERIAALSQFLAYAGKPAIFLTTVAASLQRTIPCDVLCQARMDLSVGAHIAFARLSQWFLESGYDHVSVVQEFGEYSIRGGLIDCFPPGFAFPLRLDFFGDTIETIRFFDPETQLTTRQCKQAILLPGSEILPQEPYLARFRAGYVQLFGLPSRDDQLYATITAAQSAQGMEHLLPLFYDRPATLFSYLAQNIPVIMEMQTRAIRDARLTEIAEYHTARHDTSRDQWGMRQPYRALPMERLYLSASDWDSALAKRQLRIFDPHQQKSSDAGVISYGARMGRDFAPERQSGTKNPFQALVAHIKAKREKGFFVVIASFTSEARDRLQGVLSDYGLTNTVLADSWLAAQKIARQGVALVVLPVEHGFERGRLVFIAEQDVLGDRLASQPRRKKKKIMGAELLASFSQGDYVVHSDHGVACYQGLAHIDVAGARHDCLKLEYHGGDKLYLPVENIDLVSRYGAGSQENPTLDRLGSAAWQARKARIKKRVREIADQLIKIAAERMLRKGDILEAHDGDREYEKFCAGFAFAETPEQQAAIDDVLRDMRSGRPMDRLICGDTGFGKTEIALRAAFIAIWAGRQVAMIVPTTLLARQHYQLFCERFADWPVSVAQISRLVSQNQLRKTRTEITDGAVNIVIGTHGLFHEKMRFKNLGLVIIDEEQHFGVAQKERLKNLGANIHFLTMSATPIPRTLQMALKGVREMSLISTPPIDRLAVRSHIAPFDPVLVREAFLREKYRGGQSFFVVPHIADIAMAQKFLTRYVPEIRFAIAHGSLGADQLDRTMDAFYEGAYDVLLSTTIIESGLDVPRANTMVIHHADRFGLAQLYQLRGRIGRAKCRAHAYFTYADNKKLTANAQKRLRILQSLDYLGVGFTLASHDLDIRGAGNLLGEEQSGDIKEVGFELYQSMLKEALAQLQAGQREVEIDNQWSPQVNVALEVLIPQHYISDLELRLDMYRRASALQEQEEIGVLQKQMVDRFGPLPKELQHLFQLVAVKIACRKAHIARIDIGPKGAILAFRNTLFPDPAGLIEIIQNQEGKMFLRSDHRLVIRNPSQDMHRQIRYMITIINDLGKLCSPGFAFAAGLENHNHQLTTHQLSSA